MPITEATFDTRGHVSYADDSSAYVRFHKHPYKDELRDFIELIFPADTKSVTDRPVKDSDKERFPRQWEAYLKGEVIKQEGYPLENWVMMDAGLVREYNYHHIYTVEALANMNEANINNIGFGARTLHTKAKAFVEANNDGSKIAVKLAAQNEVQKGQIEELSAKVTELMKTVELLQPKGETVPSPVKVTPTATLQTKKGKFR